MSGVEIRDADRIDLDGLSSLETKSFASDRMARQSLRRLIGRRTARLRVAAKRRTEGGAAILGYHLILFRKGSTVARLYSIAVDRAARGQGVGRRLLDDAEQIAALARKRVLRLEVSVRNRSAIALYERRGYRRIGRYRGYYADRADALRYEKDLVPASARAGVRLRGEA